MLGMITGSRHREIMASKKMQADADQQLIAKLWAENADLRARLAPFTKIRNRDSRGRFIKDTVA